MESQCKKWKSCDHEKFCFSFRDNRRVSGSPSPVFELSNQPTSGEIPAWNAANQELAAILKNLRKMDHRMQGLSYYYFEGDKTF